FFQAEDGIRDRTVTGVQTCALPIYDLRCAAAAHAKPGEYPDTFWALGERHGYDVRMSWTRAAADGCFDVVFVDRERVSGPVRLRSEERRVGKECRAGGGGGGVWERG